MDTNTAGEYITHTTIASYAGDTTRTLVKVGAQYLIRTTTRFHSGNYYRDADQAVADEAQGRRILATT